ncbi:hypothetical protein CROQUDRAFT_95880 [Cronartium quercuum f. sp. fusiforme G11]|uniref:Uncharacterized protein n=1 Tax=Cronartium quercuum f. sp. fusiforme G11 TaxID=708437 RepID=A0A9P6NHK4_9BASI|nr:hypothetical protein CROQUDRAFT_95880 [Cronartium quercuum f. sp. fusiforme G11]
MDPVLDQEPRIFKYGALAAFHALPLGDGAAHCKSSQKDEDGSSRPGGARSI